MCACPIMIKNLTFLLSNNILDGDKCKKESECMSFTNYMQLAQEMAMKRSLNRRGEKETANSTSTELVYDTIILSSESKHMLQA